MWRLAAAVLLASTAAAAASKVATFGPFEIETVEKSIGAGGFPNTTANPFARTKITVFRVKHRGTRVTAGDGAARVDEFLEAKFLEGAARPAVLLASGASWLASDEQGKLKVETLAPEGSDVAYWQWLDSKEGAPGPERGVFVRHAGEEPRVERGGSLLLLNHTAVLDIGTLAVTRAEVSTHDNVTRLDNYYAGGQPARLISPGKTQYVLVGNRNAGERGYEYALVVVDRPSGRMYAVPFDRNTLRFESATDATPEWIGRNFEWRRERDGAERLALREDAKPAPWAGRLVQFGGGMVEYRLEPTDPRMSDVLYDFVVRTFEGRPGASPLRLPDSAHSKVVFLDGQALRVTHFDNERRTTLYLETNGPPSAGYAWIEKIAERFNAELAHGRHQELFSEFKR